MPETNPHQNKPISDVMNARQRETFHKVGVYTLGDLSDYMQFHKPGEMLMLNLIAVSTLAMCMYVVIDHNLPFHKDYTVWYERDFLATKEGKVWVGKQKTRRLDAQKRGTPFSYGLGGAGKTGIKNLAELAKDSEANRVEAAEMFIKHYFIHGFDAIATCKHFGIKKDGNDTGGVVRNYIDILRTAGQYERVKRDCGVDGDDARNLVMMTLRDNLKAMKHEFQITEVYRDQAGELREIAPELTDQQVSVILNRKFIIDTLKVTREIPDYQARNNAAQAFGKNFGIAKPGMGVKGGVEVPSNPEEAKEQLVETVVRLVQAAKMDVTDLFKAVELKLAS